MIPVLETENVSLKLAGKQILKQVSIQVPSGRFVGLVGHSGCGKTSLFRCILGLKGYTKLKGSIRFRGSPIRNAPRNAYQPVFQDPSLYFNPSWSLIECLLEPLEIHNSSANRSDLEGEVYTYIEMFGLSASVLERKIHSFSGGEQQRFALIRALLCKPSLLLLDEAVSALDPLIRKEILDFLKQKILEEKLSVFLITHDLDVLLDYADFSYVMDDGEIVDSGTPQFLYEESSVESTRALADSRNLSGIRD